MCGIAGYFGNIENTRSIDIVNRMLTRIKHRGPDESGVYISEQVVLGSVRLSIIDLDSGTMPISNNDKTLWIVFNGEIFNLYRITRRIDWKRSRFQNEF